MRRFLVLFFASGILAMVAMGLMMRLKVYSLGEGCTYAVLALFVAFGRMYDRAPAQILPGMVMQARYLTLLLVGFAVVVDLVRADWPSLTGDAGGHRVRFRARGRRPRRPGRALARAPAATALPGARRRPVQERAKGGGKPRDQFWN